jgi:hypothetical protein
VDRQHGEKGREGKGRGEKALQPQMNSPLLQGTSLIWQIKMPRLLIAASMPKNQGKGFAGGCEE